MGEQLFVCGKCGKGYKRKAELTKHEPNCTGPADPGKGDQLILQAITGINTRLDQIDNDFCSRFPDLCKDVEELKKGIKPPVEYGSDPWKDLKRHDLEHTLFDECPTCGPIRDQVLASKGKRIADVEAPAEGDGGEGKDKGDGGQPETSPSPKPGFRWSDEVGLYVKPAA